MYQKYFFDNFVAFKSSLGNASIVKKDDISIEIIQNEDYRITKYNVDMFSKQIEHIEFAGKTIKPNEEQRISFALDFNSQVDNMRIYTLDGIVDPFTLTIRFVPANKEAFDLRMAEKNNKELLSKAAVRHSVGVDLVNIYFQPCSDKYERTEIQLYVNNQLMAKYKVDSEVFFKSITGLAFGVYSFILKQYDKNNELLFSSDSIEFRISKPNNNGEHVVII